MENHCYFWSSDTKKWEEAEEYCKEKRGNLADMTTMTTMTNVTTMTTMTNATTMTTMATMTAINT